ncbi:Energy-coupling factor transporter transmembrane protein EcfT [bioreactor metagenome]|uniref:Energy-coupling factor transporter transmembrane protein EcfT n=1 Tax=bioreactor metagenome TaxID=1076179 RepID=A0A644Z117_9ZZZZ
MRQGVLLSSVEDRGLVLDPRTKLLLLVTMAVFVLGGAGSSASWIIAPSLCLLPLVLLLSAKRLKSAASYIIVYLSMYFLFHYLGPKTSGILNFLLLGTAGIITRFMPSVMMGIYVVSTTTVSEFTAAMQRMYITEKLIIPMSVMFRFFPTVGDEFSSINAAMRMRGISFGGKNAGKMLEYRLIPLLTCSSKIGEELSAAALTRGLGGDVRRTNVCEIGFHIQDVAMMLLCAIPYALLVFSWFGVSDF